MGNNQIVEILKELANQLGIAVDWTSENIKPFITDLMMRNAKYELFTSLIWIAFALIVAISCIVMIKRVDKENREGDLSDDDCCGMIILFAVLIVLASFIFFCQIYDVGKALYMPELLLLETLKSLSN